MSHPRRSCERRADRIAVKACATEPGLDQAACYRDLYGSLRERLCAAATLVPGPARMTAGAINRELDRLDAKSSAIIDALIAAGRGHEPASETMRKDDHLSLRYRANADRRFELRAEIARRYGPEAPSRLPPSAKGRR